MRNSKNFLLGLIVSLVFLHFNAVGQFQLQAEIRPRFEYRDGFKTLLSEVQNPAFITTQRSRLNLSYQQDELEIYLSGQDIRVWGDEVYKTDNSVVNIYQAYAGYKFNKNFNLRVGRQELIYDDKRLLGNRNWNNVGASHDMALARYTSENLEVHLGMAYNNEKEKNYESNYPLAYYKYLNLFWLHYSINSNSGISLVNIIDGNQEPGSNNKIFNRLTTGFYAGWKNSSGNFGTNLAYYYQYGNAPNGQSLNAFYFSISPFYKISSKIKTTLGLEYFSGDDNLNPNNESNSFDKLYGNGHSPNGYMDYFTEIPKHTNYGGLMDAYLRFNFNQTEKTSWELTAHNFQLTNNIIDSISNPGTIKAADKQLGLEIDLVMKYKLHQSVSINAGYSTMFASQSMAILKGGDNSKYQQWAYLMLIFKPTLFKEIKTSED